MAKKFHVSITCSAEADIDGAHGYIAQRDPAAADRWILKLEKLIQRLERFPRAYEVIPEAQQLGMEYRHKLFGKYRIIYRIEADRVIVLRVFHTARLLDLSMLEP